MSQPKAVASSLGVGIYSREEAARLIRVRPSRLRRWVNGYTYQYRYGPTETRRKRPPVVATDLPVLDHSVALSFVELMELRVVKALRDHDVSLQEIRKAAAIATDTFKTEHPFASRRVYTDGRRVFAALADSEAPDAIELSSRRVLQVIAGGILEPFVDEIDFDEETSLAERWWPLGRRTPIVLDPRVAFGAPTIVGTRLRTSFLVDVARSASFREVADEFQLDTRSVEAAVEFESRLKAA